MIQIKTLNPFGRMCVNLGMIPTSYKESLSYEEQLLWFCKFLEEEVIPAINNNGKAVEELQKLYTQLKTYVDNYFENLDVQEEINNKLDEMASSGQLTDIIAQYLQLAGILAFNTLNDLKNASNIVDGSFTRVLCTDENDGFGNYYKIRTITSSDIIDNYNIIALNNYPTLIGEIVKDNKIKYYNTCVDMKSSNKISNGDIIYTKGYNEINDGGSAKYIITNVMPQSQYYETVGNLYAILIIEDIMNIRCFGLFGNETSYVTDKFNQILNVMQRKTLILNENDLYKFDGQILINECNIKGNGAIFKSDSSIMLDSGKIENIEIDTLNPVTRNSNGIITSNATCSLIVNDCATIDKISGNGLIIYITSANAFKISNCDINSGKSNAGVISMFNNCYDGIIENCELYGCNTNGIGIHTCHDIKIDNCNLHNNGNSGIWSPYSKNLVITNCVSHNNLYDGYDLNFGSDNETVLFKANSIISNCEAYENNATGIYIVGSYVTVDNCYLHNNVSNGLCIKRWKNEDQNYITNINIINNIIENNVTSSNVNKHQVLSEYLSMTKFINNIIRTTEANTNVEWQIYLAAVQDILINSCIVKTLNNAGINIVNKTRSYVTNTIVDNNFVNEQ